MDFELDLGKVGITPKGNWGNLTDYERLDVVTWRGASYVSKSANRGVEPGTDGNVWQLIAEKGADGQGGGGDQGGGDTIGIARHIDGILYWTRNGNWLLDEFGNKVKAEGVDGRDGKDGKDGEGGSGGGGDAVAKFKSIVFIRSQSAPVTPVGGSFDNPVPAGWYDGIPAGEYQVWSSSRWFYSDDDMTAQTSWSTPVSTTDTADIHQMFSSVENPGNPSTNPAYWHEDAVEGDKYWAVRIRRNGVWGAWSVTKVVGENGKDGKDGSSFNILGSYDTIEEAEIAHPDPNRNDVVIIDGVMYIWDGAQWANMGLETTLGMFLSSYSAIFAGGTDTALDNQSVTVDVIAKRGTELLAAHIGTITGLAAAGMSISLSDNDTDHASFTISVTDSLIVQSGRLTIPVTAGGETHNLLFSWAVAYSGPAGATGANGSSGQTGYGTVSLQLYKRAASNPSGSMPGNVTYTFGTDSISTPANGWQRTPPSNDGNPLWMVQGTGASRGNTVTISSWNGPIKFVEDGHPGKTMRGPSQWASGVNYQGLGNSGEGFVDLVYLNQNYSTLYYCKQNHTSSNSNKPGTTGGGDYWESAEVSDFLATKVFFANLAYVENLGVHFLRISDSGAIVGGFMPANTTDPDTGTNINGDALLWAGGATPTSQDTKFKVDKYGVVTAEDVNISGTINATSGEIGPYTIDQSGIEYQDTSSTGSADFYGARVEKYGEYFAKGEASGDSVFKLDTYRDGTVPLLTLSEYGRGAAALFLETGFISGFRLKVKTGGSSDMGLQFSDNLVIFNNSAARTIYLPGMGEYYDGHIIAIIHTTSSTLMVTGAGTNIVQVLSNGASEVSVAESGRPEVMLLIYSHSARKWYLSFLKSS